MVKTCTKIFGLVLKVPSTNQVPLFPNSSRLRRVPNTMTLSAPSSCSSLSSSFSSLSGVRESKRIKFSPRRVLVNFSGSSSGSLRRTGFLGRSRLLLRPTIFFETVPFGQLAQNAGRYRGQLSSQNLGGWHSWMVSSDTLYVPHDFCCFPFLPVWRVLVGRVIAAFDDDDPAVRVHLRDRLRLAFFSFAAL